MALSEQTVAIVGANLAAGIISVRSGSFISDSPKTVEAAVRLWAACVAAVQDHMDSVKRDS